MADWTLRAAVPADEACIASMWLHGLSRSQEGRLAGFANAGKAGTPDHAAFWELYQPIVTALVRTAHVAVVCDPERAEYTDEGPAVIWAWAVSDGDTVYGCGIKRPIVHASEDLARDLAADVLGDAVRERRRLVMAMPDLVRLDAVPEPWWRDERWGQVQRWLSRHVLDGDATALAVARHVVDPRRERWVPSSRRAA